MRDHEKIFCVLSPQDSELLVSVDAPATSPAPHLSLAAWDALPLAVRASDRLADMLLLIDDLETDLSSDDAADLRWIAPTIRRVDATVRHVLQRLAS